MSLLALGHAAWEIFGALALGVLLVVLVAAALHRLILSVFWRRAIWQSAMAGLILLVLFHGIRGADRRSATVNIRADGSVPPMGDTANSPSAQSALVGGVPESIDSKPPRLLNSTPEVSVAARDQVLKVTHPFAEWLLALWLAGGAAALGIRIVLRLVFRRVRNRSRTVDDPELNERVSALAHRIGLRRRVRLFESRRLSGPVACGSIRPTIGLPFGFTQSHPVPQQDVMLLHELGHLAAGDPAWYLAADFAVALLWWHPMAWWACRQLRHASEAAADEASLLVAAGPEVLAECLVQLGGRLARRQPEAWIGVEGRKLRSALALRVERLLGSRTRAWRPPPAWRTAVAKTLGPLALVTIVLLCTAWTIPQTSIKGVIMQTTFWKRSLAALALASTLGTEPKTHAAELAPPSARIASDAKRQPLQAKLETIMLEEVRFDALPLSEVVNFLIRESAARDPERAGINVLFSQSPELAPSAVDPSTGLPSAASAWNDVDLRATIIRIDPTLKKVHLSEVLDAIVRVADVPIKYSVEKYAVVFTPDPARPRFVPPPPPPAPVKPVALRTFKIDYQTLAGGAQNMLGVRLERGAANVARQLHETIFPHFGLHPKGTNVVFFNEATGTLLVRATTDELVAVQTIIEALGGGATYDGKRVGATESTAHLGEKPLLVTVSKDAPHFRLAGQPMTLAELQAAVGDAARHNPDVSVGIVAQTNSAFEDIQRLLDLCEETGIKAVELKSDKTAASR